MTATLKKIGGSLAVIIPKPLAEGMSAGDQIELTERPDGILIVRKGRRAKRPIEQILAGLDPAVHANRAKALENDPPVGREVW